MSEVKCACPYCKKDQWLEVDTGSETNEKVCSECGQLLVYHIEYIPEIIVSKGEYSND